MTNNRPKEAALDDFIDVIMRSWTWGRMTGEERERFIDALERADRIHKVITGSYQKRRETCQALYNAFLLALGYSGGFWREDETVTLGLKF